MRNMTAILFLLGCLACSQGDPADNAGQNGLQAEHNQPPQAVDSTRTVELLADRHTAWLADYQQGANHQRHYRKSAGVLIGDTMLVGLDQIQAAWPALVNTSGPLHNRETDTWVRHDTNRYFEMGRYRSKDDTKNAYAYVIAWLRDSSGWQRELEILHPVETALRVNPLEITQARQRWEELSNAHDHKKLVAELYPEGYYFSNGRLDRGVAEISERYSYMSRPDWQIQLVPISVLPVRSDLVYELGQYISNGTGHYVIVWEKAPAGHWQVLLDFNF